MNTKEDPIIKLAKFPTKKPEKKIMCIMFFISSTSIPYQGPIAKATIKAGSSEKSSLIKLGAKGNENENTMSKEEIAENIDVTTKLYSLD